MADRGGKFAIIDFETTGLSPKHGARAIEIGVVLVSGNQVVDSFSSLMNPQVPVPDQIVKLTRITNAMVSKAPSPRKVMQDVAAFIGDADLVAHNASFDRRFMEMEMNAAGVSKSFNFICTMLVSKRIFPDAPNHKLGTLVQHLSLSNNGGFHRALADAQMTTELLFRIQSEISTKYCIDHVTHRCLGWVQKASVRNTEEMIRRYKE